LREKYCAVNNGEYAPEICNEFAADLLHKYLKELNLYNQETNIIGNTDEKMTRTIYFTMHFCNWLYANYYTNERLTINDDK
jgi:hypothetical protein